MAKIPFCVHLPGKGIPGNFIRTQEVVAGGPVSLPHDCRITRKNSLLTSILTETQFTNVHDILQALDFEHLYRLQLLQEARRVCSTNLSSIIW